MADAVFAVQEADARAVVSANNYNFIWTAGALLLALAAWVRAPEADENAEAVVGMRAIALALFAQALAIGIQIYAIFREVGKSERIVTIVVLVVASVQIILTRPRRNEAGEVTTLPAPRRRQTPAEVEITLSVAAVSPELMPAAVYVGDGRIEFDEVPRPEPGPDEVLVEISGMRDLRFRSPYGPGALRQARGHPRPRVVGRCGRCAERLRLVTR